VAHQQGAWLCSCGQLLRWWRWRQEAAIGPFQRQRRGGQWRLRSPGPAVGTLGIEVVAEETADIVVEGCRSRPIQTMGRAGSKIGLELYDWSGDEIKVRLLPGEGSSFQQRSQRG